MTTCIGNEHCLTEKDLGEGDDSETVVSGHPECPEHGEVTSLSAHINRLTGAQEKYFRATLSHDEHPGSANALFSFELYDEERDQILNELVGSLLRRRLQLRAEATDADVIAKLTTKARDDGKWQATTEAYLVGVRAVLETLGQPVE
jgi:hypothetical protein